MKKIGISAMVVIVMLAVGVYINSTYEIEKVKPKANIGGGMAASCMALSPECGECLDTEFAGYCISKR